MTHKAEKHYTYDYNSIIKAIKQEHRARSERILNMKHLYPFPMESGCITHPPYQEALLNLNFSIQSFYWNFIAWV